MKRQGIGAVFTPPKWAHWLLCQYNVCEKWLSGAAVLDPSCGSGDFLLALVRIALEKGMAKKDLPLERLYGVEKEQIHREHLFQRFNKELGLNFPARNIRLGDIVLEDFDFQVDILVGNPPWQNFADLPDHYKEKLKKPFLDYGLVSNAKKLLLGSSRIDLAALVISKSINDYLKPNGEAFFFLPLSLFLNEGAHQSFRLGKIPAGQYAVTAIYDFYQDKIFGNIATRFGTASFRRDGVQHFPLPYYIKKGEQWIEHQALPLHSQKNALSIFPLHTQTRKLREFKIPVSSANRARQGVNSCGAAALMIFYDYQKIDRHRASVRRKDGREFLLPAKYLFPLLDKIQFDKPDASPKKYILLAYSQKSGKPLSTAELNSEKELQDYFNLVQDQLQKRKGTLIQNQIQRGTFWACLGAGKYSFSPYKIAWQAFGTKIFKPILVSDFKGQPWQGNQAMHAFIPAYNLEEANDILKGLKQKETEVYLASFRMQGTKSWAQPGRINALLEFYNAEDNQQELFS